MQQVHSEWGMYIAIAMYQITLTSEEEKSYPSCYVKHGYPTTLSIYIWPLTIQVTISKIHLKRFENVVEKLMYRNDLLVEKETNLSSL